MTPLSPGGLRIAHPGHAYISDGEASAQKTCFTEESSADKKTPPGNLGEQAAPKFSPPALNLGALAIEDKGEGKEGKTMGRRTTWGGSSGSSSPLDGSEGPVNRVGGRVSFGSVGSSSSSLVSPRVTSSLSWGQSMAAEVNVGVVLVSSQRFVHGQVFFWSANYID